MAIRVLHEQTTTCEVCGDVACERDLVYLDDDEAEAIGLSPGAIVCTDCMDGES